MAKKRTRTPPVHAVETEYKPSASYFDSAFRCPGKLAIEAPLPYEEDTALTKRGRKIHKALEESSLEGLSDTDRRTTERIMYGEAELVHEYSFEGAEVMFEERFWDFDEGFNKLWSGRVDRHDWQPDSKRLLIIDNKTGWGLPVPVAENWQVRSEAALLTEFYGAEEAVVALIHPHHPDSLWEAKLYTRRQLLELLDTVRHNVAMIQMPDQRRVPGGIQCEWCMAKRICEEYKERAAKLAQDTADEIKDEGFTAIIRRSPDERGLHVSELKSAIKNMQGILDQYVKLAVKEDAGVITGYTLRRSLKRTVTSEADAMALIRSKWGGEAVYSALSFSVSQLETYLAKEKQMGMKEVKAAVSMVLKSVLQYKKSDYFLAESRSL